MIVDLSELLLRLHHPAVRDLAWTLLSPPLLREAPAQQRHPLVASRWWASPGLLADWLLRQETDPSRLLDWLARGSNRRLGLYYERLWQFALAHAPDIELMAANLPVRVNGHTLGELDLVLRDPAGLQHCELAVKFYLCLANTDPSRHDSWVGPGGCDRLDIKLDRLLRHQLQLTGSDAGRATLRELSAHPPQPSLWLGGYLFAPGPSRCEAPTPSANHAWWEHHRWPSVIRGSRLRWTALPRAAWLAPARHTAEFLSKSEPLAAWLAGLPPLFQPYLMVGLEQAADGWTERERCFLVPDGWPGVIQPLG